METEVRGVIWGGGGVTFDEVRGGGYLGGGGGVTFAVARGGGSLGVEEGLFTGGWTGADIRTHRIVLFNISAVPRQL